MSSLLNPNANFSFCCSTCSLLPSSGTSGDDEGNKTGDVDLILGADAAHWWYLICHLRSLKDGVEVPELRWLVCVVRVTDWMTAESFCTSSSSSSSSSTPCSPSLPPLLPIPVSPFSLSSSSVLVIHRVDASQLNLTEPLNRGTCHNSFLSLSTRHLPEHDLTAAVWSLICFPVIRCESCWIRPGGPVNPATLQSPRKQGIMGCCDFLTKSLRKYKYFIFYIYPLCYLIVFNYKASPSGHKMKQFILNKDNVCPRVHNIK